MGARRPLVRANGRIVALPAGDTIDKASVGLDSTDSLPEGATNKYFSAARVLAALLAGIDTVTIGLVLATDSVLGAIGKLQAQITARPGKNLITNGLFNVNQRVYTSGTPTTAANQFTYDRWRVLASGQAITLAGVVATFPAGGGGQVIDGRDVLIGGIHTLSWTGTGTATVNGTAVANGGQVSLAAGTNVALVFIGQISYPKLEFGPVKTAWDSRPYADELRLCRLFYRTSFERGVKPAQASGSYLGAASYLATNNGQFYMSVPVAFGEPMRAVPTLTFYNPASATATWRNRASASDESAGQTPYSEASTSGFLAFNIQTVNTTAGATICVHYAAEAELLS